MATNAYVKNRSYERVRSYEHFRGVELGGGADTDISRLSYAENMWRDYDGDGGDLIESVPGYRRIAELGEAITGIWRQKIGEGEDCLIVLAGHSIYRFKISMRDTLGTPTPIGSTVSDRVIAFPSGKNMFLIDGERLIKISSDGALEIIEPDDDRIYRPTRYYNGEELEDRNLLSDRFLEEYELDDISSHTRATGELIYKINDTELSTCIVADLDLSYKGAVYVPSETVIDGRTYKVMGIGQMAFRTCVYVTEVYIAEGVEFIENRAFLDCASLKKVVLPRSLRTIGDNAFEDCEVLEYVSLGIGLESVGDKIFTSCPKLTNITYPGKYFAFQAITNVASIPSEIEVTYYTEDTTAAITLPVMGLANTVEALYENGVPVDFEAEYEGDAVKAVHYYSKVAKDSTVKLTIHLKAMTYKSSFGTQGSEYTGKEAILGCTVSEIFDGRVFLSGNPKLPNTVFFSQRQDTEVGSTLYFPSLSYFNDGIGGYPVTSLLSANGMLAVFKSGDDGSGSIFYHSPSQTDDNLMPKLYPVAYVHSGIGGIGASYNFMDDPVFISKAGLSALEKATISYDRSIACRSHNVNYDLLKEDPKRIILTEWCGYLAVCAGENIYLADSRTSFRHKTGNLEYEWYIIKGVGSYKNSTRVYRYASFETDTSTVHPTNEGNVANGTMYSAYYNGELYNFVLDSGKQYTVSKTEEMTGGDFSCATYYLGADDLLFFGTQDGALCVFNNDKRGVAPDYIRNMKDFDEEEYLERYSRRIHPSFYSFDNHAVRYLIKTAYDNCDIPHLTKSTVKHSLVIKIKAYTSSEITVEVGREGKDYRELSSFPGSEFCFTELDFGNISLDVGDYHTLPVAEREKGWVEKQISISSDRFCSPLGIYSLTYRYTVKGRIRRS